MGWFSGNVSYGCAVDGDNLLFTGIKYNSSSRTIEVCAAHSGTISNRTFVKGLVRKYLRHPVWFPVNAISENQQSDIRICKIDDGGGAIKGKDLKAAMESQLRRIEANQNGDYFREMACRSTDKHHRHWIAGSIPAKIVTDTFNMWRDLGFKKPYVGLRHVALVNLFLAIHPEADATTPPHRLLACQQTGLDIFCYMKGAELRDCGYGSIPDGASFDQHMNVMSDWAGSFAKKHGILDQRSLKAYVISGEAIALPDNLVNTDLLEFWAIPWGESVTFANASVEATVTSNKELALRSIGLALHGV